MIPVLVVEDDGATREMLRDLLEEEGYHVTTAPDGRVALPRLWMTDAPLVVLLDQRMPGLTGSEVVEVYFQAGAPTRPREFIVLTASPDQVATSRNGRVPVVGKPFHLEALLEAVARAAARLEAQ